MTISKYLYWCCWCANESTKLLHEC